MVRCLIAQQGDEVLTEVLSTTRVTAGCKSEVACSDLAHVMVETERISHVELRNRWATAQLPSSLGPGRENRRLSVQCSKTALPDD